MSAEYWEKYSGWKPLPQGKWRSVDVFLKCTTLQTFVNGINHKISNKQKVNRRSIEKCIVRNLLYILYVSIKDMFFWLFVHQLFWIFIGYFQTWSKKLGTCPLFLSLKNKKFSWKNKNKTVSIKLRHEKPECEKLQAVNFTGDNTCNSFRATSLFLYSIKTENQRWVKMGNHEMG